VTKKGRLYAGLMRLKSATIRSIKRNPRLFAAVQDGRALAARCVAWRNAFSMPVSLTSQIPQRSTLATPAAPLSERASLMQRRDALFRESAPETCRRVVLGTAWALLPRRIGQLLPLTRLWLADLVRPACGLPDPKVPAGAGEFAGMVHDLTPPTLIAAYRHGLFPMGHFGPLKWMSPGMRCVLAFEDFHISKRLRAIMRQGRYRVSFDRDFDGIIRACAGRRAGRWPLTWISPRIMHAYAALHDEGHAHSFEVWNQDGALVGGGYGVALGGAFVIESQFSKEPNSRSSALRC
jgi:leucyl/phenylalanyl-tRNA--protein transferase